MVSKTVKCVVSAVVALLLVAAYGEFRGHAGSASVAVPRRMLQATAGRTITIPWSIQTYAPMTIQVGDTVTFQWASTHGLSLLPTAACPPSFSDSNVRALAIPSAGGSFSVTASAPGTFVYACPVGNGGHCNAGQRITITVVAAGAAAGGAASTVRVAPAPAPGPTSSLPLVNTAPVAAAAPAARV